MTVATEILSRPGWNVRLPSHNNPWNPMKTTQEVAPKFARVFGVSGIIARLCSGCATGTPAARPMLADDLIHFQVDCRIKDHQRAFLESMRLTREDVFFNRMNVFEEKYGDVNSKVNFYLFTCPPWRGKKLPFSSCMVNSNKFSVCLSQDIKSLSAVKTSIIVEP